MGLEPEEKIFAAAFIFVLAIVVLAGWWLLKKPGGSISSTDLAAGLAIGSTIK